MTLSKHTRTRLIWRGGKKVRAHRWLASQQIGRAVLPSEDVHHKNRDPLDNTPSNLEVLPRRKHQALHAAEKQIYPDTKDCSVCGGAFRVNPRKRKRNKTCSRTCAMSLRIAGRQRQAVAVSNG